jgi:hypothetical protein
MNPENKLTTDQMNEVIALFMGMKLEETYPSGYIEYEWVPSFAHSTWCFKEPPPFERSWGWLMPVVEKIESIYDDFHGYFGVHISSNSCCIQGTNLRTDPGHEHYAYFNEVVYETKILATHYAVYQFIEWYNKKSNEHQPK